MIKKKKKSIRIQLLINSIYRDARLPTPCGSSRDKPELGNKFKHRVPIDSCLFAPAIAAIDGPTGGERLSSTKVGETVRAP